MSVSYDFTGQVALVTGAGSGIGRSSAMAFAAAGAAVAVADISPDAGQGVVDEIVAAGGTARYFVVDVTSSEAVDALVADVVNAYGRLDVAHNNAGIEAEPVALADLAVDAWRRVIDVNLSGVFVCLRAEIAAMLPNGSGAIVNTASASGLIGGYRHGDYTAAKHGVVGLTKAAALDYATSGIRVNAVCPGLVDTPFVAYLPPAALERLMFGTPMSRLAQPDEIAQAVLWLCSDAASYVTGHALAVDGGVTIGGIGTRFDGIEF